MTGRDKGEDIVFDNLNFDVPADHRLFTGGRVGKVELPSGVVFGIEKRVSDTYFNKGLQHNNLHFIVRADFFGAGIDIFQSGEYGIDFATQEEVIAYLTQQLSKDPQYTELRAKRKAIGDRLKPLQDKWLKINEAILNLAKS